MHGQPGRVCSQSTWSPELLRPGKDTKHTPNPQRVSQNCVRVSPVEVQVSSGLLQQLWVQQTWVCWDLLEEVAINPTIEPPELTQDRGNRLLEGTSETLCVPGSGRNEQ